MNSLSKLGLMVSLCLLFACNEREDTIALYDGLMESHVRIAKSLDDVKDVQLWQLSDRLEDESKRKYRPVKVVVDTIHQMIEEVESHINSHLEIFDKRDAIIESGSNVKKLNAEIIELNKNIFQFYSAFLFEYKDTFSLNEDQVDSRFQDVRKEIDSLDSLLQKTSLVLDDLQMALLLSEINIHLKSIKYKITADFSKLIGSKGLYCFFYYTPVVLPLKKAVNEGEEFSAIILGSEDFMESTYEFYSIEVNGETLDIIDGKYAVYQKTVSDVNKTLTINCQAGSKLTGAEVSFYENYTYPITIKE